MVKVGIYKLIDLNGRIYIGSSKELRKRKYDHFRLLKLKIHPNPKLQCYANKNGVDSLTFEILEECSEDELLEREQFYINSAKPHFNICLIAGNTSGVPRSKEAIRKTADSNRGRKRSDEFRKRLSDAHRGKILTDETKRRISESKIGQRSRLGGTLSDEAKLKISIANTGNTFWVGRKHSEESRLKMSQSKKGLKPRLGIMHSEETKMKISETKRLNRMNRLHNVSIT